MVDLIYNLYKSFYMQFIQKTDSNGTTIWHVSVFAGFHLHTFSPSFLLYTFHFCDCNH